VDEGESRSHSDYASSHKEVDGDVGSQVLWDEALEEAVQLCHATSKGATRDRSKVEYPHAEPDYASSHKEVDGDVGSQVLWDEALEGESSYATPPQREQQETGVRSSTPSRIRPTQRCQPQKKVVPRSWTVPLSDKYQQESPVMDHYQRTLRAPSPGTSRRKTRSLT
jgi:hypothetical protein